MQCGGDIPKLWNSDRMVCSRLEENSFQKRGESEFTGDTWKESCRGDSVKGEKLWICVQPYNHEHEHNK